MRSGNVVSSHGNILKQPLDNFFKKHDNPEVNHQFTSPPSFKDILGRPN